MPAHPSFFAPSVKRLFYTITIWPPCQGENRVFFLQLVISSDKIERDAHTVGGDGMEKVETLGKRLSQLMEERELNYDRLGRLLDMKPQTLNRYVLGQREPKARVVTEMAVRLDVDPMWLQGYDVARSASAPQSAGAPLLPVLEQWDPELPAHRQSPLYYLPAEVTDPEGCFYLVVRDDSMLLSGIRRGDLLLIRRQSTARSGQLVLCAMDHLEPVLRRFHLQGSWAVVHAEAPGAMPRLFALSELEGGRLRILGVALSLKRIFE